MPVKYQMQQSYTNAILQNYDDNLICNYEDIKIAVFKAKLPTSITLAISFEKLNLLYIYCNGLAFRKYLSQYVNQKCLTGSDVFKMKIANMILNCNCSTL